MKADADVVGAVGKFRHQTLCRAHDELEMSDVVALLRADHQKLVLPVRASVQAVSPVEHEDLERGDAVVDDELLHLVDVPRLDRRDVEAVVDPEIALPIA